MILARVPGMLKRLGTAAFRNTGTTAGKIPLLDSLARLPAVDGSQLTGMAAGDPVALALGAADLSINLIYTAKNANLAPLRFLDGLADGFAGSTGLTGGTNFLVDTTNRKLRPTRADVRIAAGITPIATFLGGTPANLNDNNTATVSTTSAIGDKTANTVADGQRWFAKYDLGSIKTISKIEAVGASQSAGGASFEFYTSTDNATWTLYGIVHGTDVTPRTFADSVSRDVRYVIMVLAALNWVAITFTTQDLNVFTATGAAQNMTVTPVTQTADAVPGAISGYFIIDPIDAPTLNTDLTLEVSRDGGTTWTTATLSLAGGLSGTQKLYQALSVNVTAQPSNTAPTFRLKTLNSKYVDVYGWVLSWR